MNRNLQNTKMDLHITLRQKYFFRQSPHCILYNAYCITCQGACKNISGPGPKKKERLMSILRGINRQQKMKYPWQHHFANSASFILVISHTMVDL